MLSRNNVPLNCLRTTLLCSFSSYSGGSDPPSRQGVAGEVQPTGCQIGFWPGPHAFLVAPTVEKSAVVDVARTCCRSFTAARALKKDSRVRLYHEAVWGGWMSHSKMELLDTVSNLTHSGGRDAFLSNFVQLVTKSTTEHSKTGAQFRPCFQTWVRNSRENSGLYATDILAQFVFDWLGNRECHPPPGSHLLSLGQERHSSRPSPRKGACDLLYMFICRAKRHYTTCVQNGEQSCADHDPAQLCKTLRGECRCLGIVGKLPDA